MALYPLAGITITYDGTIHALSADHFALCSQYLYEVSVAALGSKPIDCPACLTILARHRKEI